MHKIWQMFSPALVLTGLTGFLFILGFTIHFILLSTAEFNWLSGL